MRIYTKRVSHYETPRGHFFLTLSIERRNKNVVRVEFYSTRICNKSRYAAPCGIVFIKMWPLYFISNFTKPQMKPDPEIIKSTCILSVSDYVFLK